MNVDKFVRVGLGIKTLVGRLRQKMARQPIGLRHVLVGLGVLVPSVAAAGSFCIEDPFIGSGTTGWFSEENSVWKNLPGFVRGADFRGSYSDDLNISYYSLNTASYTFGSESAEIIVSDETGTKACPQDMWVSSIRCSGRYCDNVHFKCREVFKGTTKLKWSINSEHGWFSDEEYKSNFACPQYFAVNRIDCGRDYCDDMHFTCTAFATQ
jgi:hypothetical protein